MTDLKELIEQELDQYLEWPTADKSHVTTVSAKLFAEHVATLYADHIPDAGKMVAPAGQGEPVSLRQRLFNGWQGCSNHGCVVVDPKPGTMRTNGTCKCVVNASRSQLYLLQGRIQSVLSATHQKREPSHD